MQVFEWRTDVLAGHTLPRSIHSPPHDDFHVVAAAGDTAEELRSLGVFEASSARLALAACLSHLDHDPTEDGVSGLVGPDDVMELLRLERLNLREALAEPDVSFIVVPIQAETHLVRDLDGAIKDATSVGRQRAWMRRDFGIDLA